MCPGSSDPTMYYKISFMYWMSFLTSLSYNFIFLIINETRPSKINKREIRRSKT